MARATNDPPAGCANAACSTKLTTRTVDALTVTPPISPRPWPRSVRRSSATPARSNAAFQVLPRCYARRRREALRAVTCGWRRRPAPSGTPCGGRCETPASQGRHRRAPRPDADCGVKGSGEKKGTKKHYWFGYLLHLVVDATYEVPLAFEVTKASTGEQPQAQRLLDQMQDRHPELLHRCERMSADKGYDDHKLINRLWQQLEIKPIIDIRNCWKDGEAEEDGVLTKRVSGQDNVIYTHDGQVSCMCPQTGELHRMAYGGFEQDRETLKYRCPARYLGITCEGMDQCPVSDAVRIPLAEDRRVFTPVARSSYRWQDFYDQRGAVERVNSRLAGGFGFERPGIRGLAKMQLRITMALTIMLAMTWAHPRRPTREPAESGQTRLTGDRSPVTKKPNPTGSSARPVCPDRCIEPRMEA